VVAVERGPGWPATERVRPHRIEARGRTARPAAQRLEALGVRIAHTVSADAGVPSAASSAAISVTERSSAAASTPCRGSCGTWVAPSAQTWTNRRTRCARRAARRRAGAVWPSSSQASRGRRDAINQVGAQRLVTALRAKRGLEKVLGAGPHSCM